MPRCVLVIYLLFLGVILWTVDAENEPFVMKKRGNRTAVGRERQAGRVKLDSHASRYDETDSYLPRPTRYKDLKKHRTKDGGPPRSKAIDPDYGNEGSRSKIVRPPSYKTDTNSGFRPYFQHKDVGNVGKIFNQDDINDVYLRGNNDYDKLVNRYKNSFRFVFSTPAPKAELSAYNKPSEYEKLNGNSGRYEKYLKEESDSHINFGQYERPTSLNDQVDDYKTIAETDKKDTNDVHAFGIDTSKGYGNLKNSYGEYIAKGVSNSNNNSGKSTDFTNSPSNTKDLSYFYGQKLETTKPPKMYSFSINEGFGTTPDPFSNYDQKYAIEYANQYNFGSKPLSEVQPSKYSIPDYTHGKFSLKTADYVSDFDAKGNPISPTTTVAPEYVTNINSITTNKDFIDYTNLFYSINKSPTQNYFKPTEPSVFLGSSANSQSAPSNLNQFNFKPSGTSSGPSHNLNNGYHASSFDYSSFYGPQYGISSDHYLKNPNFNKYEFPSVQKEIQYPVSSPMQVPHPILVPVPHPYPVRVPVARPVAVPILKEIKVPIEKLVPYAVIKNVPYPVEKPVPFRVEKQVRVEVPQPYPVKIPIIKNVYHHTQDEEPHVPRKHGRGRPGGRPRKRPRGGRHPEHQEDEGTDDEAPSEQEGDFEWEYEPYSPPRPEESTPDRAPWNRKPAKKGPRRKQPQRGHENYWKYPPSKGVTQNEHEDEEPQKPVMEDAWTYDGAADQEEERERRPHDNFPRKQKKRKNHYEREREQSFYHYERTPPREHGGMREHGEHGEHREHTHNRERVVRERDPNREQDFNAGRERQRKHHERENPHEREYGPRRKPSVDRNKLQNNEHNREYNRERTHKREHNIRERANSPGMDRRPLPKFRSRPGPKMRKPNGR